MINWLLNKRLKWRKIKTLHEIRADINFLESAGKVMSSKQEANARAQLRTEQAKEKPDQAKIDDLSLQIANGLAARKEMENLRRIERELPGFIQML